MSGLGGDGGLNMYVRVPLDASVTWDCWLLHEGWVFLFANHVSQAKK